MKPPADLVELFYDAERFVLEFFDPISLSALHIYHSALPFVPSSTRLRRTYAHELTGVLTVISGLPESWGTCFRVISTTSPVRSLSFSPDKTYIASGTDKDGVQLWNVATGLLFATLGGGGNLSCSVVFSTDGKRIAAGGQDGTIYMWDIGTGLSLVPEKQHGQPVTGVSFTPDSTCLASASSDKDICLWDGRTGHFLSRLCGHSDGVTRLAFSPNSCHLASASTDNTIRVWDRTSSNLLTLSGHKGAVNSVAFSPSGTLIASGSADKTVRIWDAATGKCTATSHAHKKDVIAVKFSSDGSSVVSVSDEMAIKLFTIAGRKSTTLWSFNHFMKEVVSIAPSRRVRALSFVPDVLYGYAAREFLELSLDAVGFSASTTPLAISVSSNTFILHNLEPANPAPFMGRGFPSSALAFSLDSTCIASGSPVKDIFICDPNFTDETWEQIPLRYQFTEIRAASPDGTRFVASSGGVVSLLDAQGSIVCELLTSLMYPDEITMFSPDSRLIALPSWTGSVHLFDARSGAVLRGVSASLRGILISETKCVAFSPDGSHLAVGISDHTVQVRSVATGQQVARIKEAVKGDITCLMFSPDGDRIALGDSTGAVKCWKWSSNDIRTNSKPHKAAVTSIVFRPNGAQIVSGSSEGSLRAWFPESDLTPWETSSISITSLAFHPSSDGLRLFCRSKQQAVEVWDFGKDEADKLAIPCVSWRTEDGCFMAEQSFDRNLFMRDDGWLFDGESRICWVPKSHRPCDNQFFMGENRLICKAQRRLVILDFSNTGRA